MSKTYDAMVVLEQPIKIENNVIYGIVYNTEVEYQDADDNKNFNDRIDTYCAYMLALSRFLEEGGHVSLDKYTWTYPNGDTLDLRNREVREGVAKLMKGKVRYKTLEYSQPLVLSKGDIDDDLILNPTVIEKYSIENHIVKGGHI